MRAKQSFTALEMYSSTGSFTTASPLCATLPGFPAGVSSSGRMPLPRPTQSNRSQVNAAVADGEGLLHDARNLMGALGLYCDLLSMPGVLKPEHRHYAEEVRLLGTRSAAMIQQLMERRVQALTAEPNCQSQGASAKDARVGLRRGAGGWLGACGSREIQPVSLRTVMERCAGLLRRVAGGRAIGIDYGPAASVPVGVPDEAVERILVNLVRNAAAALARKASEAGPAVAMTNSALDAGGVNPAADAVHGTIRIGVGKLVNRVGDPTPWPFRRVRLTIEDSGCGMSPEQLERLLCGNRAPGRGSHGIGFHVVRELVAASDGDLRMISAPGAGTRVQIEWPIAGGAQTEEYEGEGAERGQTC